MIEEWRPVVGFEDRYKVSNFGRLRSVTRVDNAGRLYRGRDLTLWPDGKGYLKFNLCRNQVRTSKFIHTIVLETFVGPKPFGMLTRHLDGNPLNNRLDNLVWGTPHENNMDILRHGRHHETKKTHCPAGHKLAEPNLANRRTRQCKACQRAGAFVWRRPEFKPHFEAVADIQYEIITGVLPRPGNLLALVDKRMPGVFSGAPARYTYGPGNPRPSKREALA